MKKLYAGIAATALAATGIACTAGAVHADVAPWSSLDYAPSANGDMISTAVGSDGTIYTASPNGARDGINVSTTTPAGASTHRVVTLTPTDGMSIDDIGSVVVTSAGKLVISAAQSSDDYDAGVWTARVGDDAATETISGLDGTGPVAVSSDGQHAALATYATLYSFAPSDTTATSVAFDEDEDAYVDVTALAVSDSGDAYAVGEDSANTPMGWNATAGDPTASPLQLAATPVSVAVAGSTVVIGERQETGDEVAYSLEVVAATSEPRVVPLPDEPDVLAVSPNGGTLFASDGYDVDRVDLTQVDSYTAADRVPAQQFDAYEIFGLGATSDKLYAVASAYDGDTDSYETASLLRLTKPGAVTNATQTVYADGSINVEWKAPADTGGVDPSYVVTLTDKLGKVITDKVTDTYDYLDSRKGLRPGSTYTITVRAENAAFSGQDVPVAPVLPGASTVTVSGSAVVGGTLIATVSNKWPAGTKVSYQWGYSGGQYGGPVDGATGRTFAPTADLAGLQVTVRVTGTLAGYSPTTVTSAPVVIKAAAHTAPKPAPKPEKVAKIKPATIKAGAKKVKVNLPGVTVAKAPGKVKVYDGKKLIGTATIKNGKLVLKLKKKLHKGKHKIKVKYAGSAQVAKFTKTVKVTVK